MPTLKQPFRFPAAIEKQFAAFGAADYALAVVAVCGLLLVIAQVLETGFGWQPCGICLAQRLAFLLCGAIAMLGLAHRPRLGIYALAVAFFAGIGALLAIRHLWLLSLPADALPACSAPFDFLIAQGAYLAAFTSLFGGTGDCAVAAWPLFGLQIPGWAIPGGTLAGYTGVALLSFAQWQSRFRRIRPARGGERR